MKTKEELNELKIEYEAMNEKLTELTEEELAQVAGGDNQGCTGLHKYLKTLCTDKSRILVDHGDSLQQQVRRIRGYSLYPTLVIKSAVVAASFAWFSMFFFSGPPMII